MTRAARDLTAEQEEHILSADNGDWRSPTVVHYCLRHECPLQCRGSVVRSRSLVLAALTLSVGGAMCLPLLCRWKRFEKAAAWALRGCRQHRLLSRALCYLYPAGRERSVCAAWLGRGENDCRGNLLLVISTCCWAFPRLRCLPRWEVLRAPDGGGTLGVLVGGGRAGGRTEADQTKHASGPGACDRPVH